MIYIINYNLKKKKKNSTIQLSHFSHEKNRDIANEDDNVSAEVFISPSVSLLFVAHEYLGK